MNKLLITSLIVVGIINLLPALGVVSAEAQERSYRVTLASNDLAILMRHRALLFGLIGGFVLVSAFVSMYQLPAMVMAGVSMVGFVLLAYSVGDYNPAIHKVMIVDYIGIAALTIAIVVKLKTS